jgi:hypothetical protein
LRSDQRICGSWAPGVDTATAARAIAVARDVAARFRDRDAILRINGAAREQTRYPDSVHWEPRQVAQGDAGVALACVYLDACWPDQGWLETGQRHLAIAIEHARVAPLPLGIFAGLAGLGFAATSYSRLYAQYRRFVNTLDAELSTRALDAAARLHGRHGIAVAEFDLISGLSGVAAYMLSANAPPPTDVALQAILDAFVTLTETSAGIPHWYTPNALMNDNPMARFFPEGNLNCGLAHGIPGPLALMALAIQGGYEADGLRQAVERTADWLVRHRNADEYGVNWPTVVPWTADGRVPVERLDASRAAWCYGAPGIARSLWLAGQAIDAPDLCALAIDAMSAVYRRPIAARHIDSPTFCHGVAGLLQITLRFLNDTSLPVFRDAANELCRQLLAEHRTDRPLGFCCIEPEGNRVDQAGLLDGALGVVLVLLAATTDREPTWDRLFLLT